MIAVDTSALMSILLDEADAISCVQALETASSIVISAGTAAEALIVAGRRGVADEMSILLTELGIEIVPVTAASARRVAQAYERWGKGLHAANLNFGDCFAYEIAKDRNCPLLYVGADFSQTDVPSAL